MKRKGEAALRNIKWNKSSPEDELCLAGFVILLRPSVRFHIDEMSDVKTTQTFTFQSLGHSLTLICLLALLLIDDICRFSALFIRWLSHSPVLSYWGLWDMSTKWMILETYKHKKRKKNDCIKEYNCQSVAALYEHNINSWISRVNCGWDLRLPWNSLYL